MRLLARTWMLLAIVLVSARTAWSQDFRLPDGRGKDLVERHCVRCHDAQKLAGPDGGHWYTGQASSRLGRLDPSTGEVRNYPLRPDNTKLPYGVGPHGLVADKDRYIWYTGQQDGHLGKLDPKTGVVTKYKIPNPSAGGPHTPIFDQNGTLWFTMQQGNMVGRLTPATGEIKLVTMPTANSEPYGLVINSKIGR